MIWIVLIIEITTKREKPKQSSYTTTKNKKSVIDDSSKNKIIEKRIKNRLKIEIKGGLSDIHTLSGRELIQQAFS